MNLVDELLKSDAKKASELTTKTITSKRLATLLGKDEPVEITIKEIKSKRLNEIVSMQLDKKGNFNPSKMYEAKILTCTEGIIDPPIDNEELLEHFGCATPKDLVEKLFGNETTKISDEIMKLGDFIENPEDEIKN